MVKRAKGMLFLFTVAVSVLLFSVTSQAFIKASLPTPRMAAASAVVDGKVYIIGGFSKQGRSSSVVEVYDPIKDKWSQMSSMPTSRGMTSAIAIGRIVYVIGGRNENGITNIVEAYDTVQNSWKKVKSMSTARWNHMVVEDNGQIYVLGGITGIGNARQATNKVEIYDPAKNVWLSETPLPQAKQGAAVVVNKGQIYILGGRTGAGESGYATNTVEVYDIIKKTWRSVSPMRNVRTGPKACCVDSRIYVIGGATDGEATNSVEVYDLASNSWVSPLAMQKPRTGHSVALVDKHIFVIGGAIEESLSGITGMVEELRIKK